MFVPGKCERKKIERKNGRKEKAKKININFFTCLVNHEKKSMKNEMKTKSTIYLK